MPINEHHSPQFQSRGTSGAAQRRPNSNCLTVAARCLFGAALLVTTIVSATIVDAFAGGALREEVLPRMARAAAFARQPVDRPEPPPQHIYLIRATLASLSDANRTGNYSVLRDLASPAFQAANSPADLAQLFRELRQKNADLAAALVSTPRIGEASGTDHTGRLRLVGEFLSAGERILFDLGFEPVAGHWRLSALSVGITPLAQAAPPRPPRSP